ncbi:ras-specific guanine nucleotide-releasing factor RalGPS2 [Nematostella vectensis]|uniref:ras-specific guanine nucleotide-releasing factor RalGPS2 n=1 Tax=Nematostella vectensis TaxID=45351 RepID=UPI0020772F14|nr:ras-specific guanine nucleotide-releasing factor RalGPS2 [Nematostella vectensis]XP_032228031.2 ras-specific guanine nucleotide-releasing factor RalGPS2 [Nematostella vectensis]XP_032228032.2 ras-specific guanine nucleotide-releasing factor RalGPS2 [Nematostella vectensis]
MTEKSTNKREIQHLSLRPNKAPHINIIDEDFSSTSSNESQEVTDDEVDAIKNYDAVVFDITKVTPDNFARQLTYMDLAVFKSIQPEEFSSCGWTKKNKSVQSPNVVALTKRFNHVSFWVVREILNAKKLKTRVAVMSHFIRIAKRLYEMNNLHSLKAVIAGLQSAPVYRLNQTWEQLSRRDHTIFEKLEDLLSEDQNRKKLRDHLNSTRLPCIPHLGMYLTDLMYIDTIHPNTGGLDNERTRKMNDIIRIIAEFQQSHYDCLETQPHIQKYLDSMNYIEELQKFLEDNNYRLSLQIEPKSVKSSGEATSGVNLSRSRESLSTYPVSPKASTSQVSKFVPGHRKAYSLGTNVLQTVGAPSLDSLSIASIASSTGSRNLLDDSILDDQGSGILVNGRDSELSLEKGSGMYESEESNLFMHQSEFLVEGFLKRKKCLRNGKKLAVSYWQKFWVGLNGAYLYYFLPKHRSVGRGGRLGFKSEAQKVVCIQGWTVVMQSDARHPACFQLTDDVNGNSYKFKCGSQSVALMWYTYLSQATNLKKNQPPPNLISFEEGEEPTSN